MHHVQKGFLKFNPDLRLPYFDRLLREFENGNQEALDAFGRNVHWGYWKNPSKADGTLDDFAAATEAMTERILDVAGIGDKQNLLDAGCGFGGTLARVNRSLRNVTLTGLNIDARQLARARDAVKARKGNKIEFIEGDACSMPFDDASFDAMTAVECIFHFPSRLKFLQEAARTLKAGGRLALSDFVLARRAGPVAFAATWPLLWMVKRTYGTSDSNIDMGDYRDMAEQVGLELVVEEDVTRNTLPTYPVLLRLFGRNGDPLGGGKIATRIMQLSAHLGAVRYMILGFAKHS